MKFDLTGKKFGKWTVLERASERGVHRILWRCQCECGKIKLVDSPSLRNGLSKSCGKGICYRKFNHFGEKFGRWTVLDESAAGFWKCKCECGTIKEIDGCHLRDGNSQSCGCLRKDLNSLPSGEAAFNEMFTCYRHGASERKYEFNLTKEEFRTLAKLNCFYCGEPPQPKMTRTERNGSFIGNGLDRFNNDLGYTIKNSVPCCPICNFMKRNLTAKDFLSQCQKITKHQSSHL